MPCRLPLVLIAFLALLGTSSPASAQLSGDQLGGNGQNCLQSATNNDGSLSVGLDFNLWAWFRADVMSTFSWGRGTTGRPGSLRSSSAVLRERHGLMLR